MKKVFLVLLAITGMALSAGAQESKTVYVMKNGAVVYHSAVSNIDSIIFYAPANIAVTGVALKESALNLSVLSLNTTATLTPVFTPEYATNKTVKWSSSNTAVATVNETTGLITAVAPGTTTITVTTDDGNKTATCPVTVYTVFDGFDRPDVAATAGQTPNPIGADWKNLTATWRITDGQVACDDWGNKLMTHTQVQCSGLFKVETDVYINVDDGSNDMWAGIAFSCIDDNNCLVFRISGGTLHMLIRDNGDWSGIAYQASVTKGRTWYHFEASSKEETGKFHIKLTLKDTGAVVAEADFTSEKYWNCGGTAGFYNDNAGLFDNFAFTKF